MWTPQPRRTGLCRAFFVAVVSLWTLFSFFAVWYGLNSDHDDIPQFLTEVLPAGHCTCEISTNFECESCFDCQTGAPKTNATAEWNFDYVRDRENLALSSIQCEGAFPGLFEDIARAREYWIRQGNLRSALACVPLAKGMTRAAIINGKLNIVATKSRNEDHRRKMLGILSSIHQALAADPVHSGMADFEFVFSVEDTIAEVASKNDPIWALARKPSEEAAWLMPDFGMWAWENKYNSFGPYNQVVDDIIHEEQNGLSWTAKNRQLVWRGKLSFAPKLRRMLLQATKRKPWADVKELVWTRRDAYLSLQEHCKYMFIAHVEGRSYSASLKYRQSCRSVVVAHKMQYLQHHHYLLVRDGPLQNFVEVERDFSDLPTKVEQLLADPAAAKRIADNSVETFRERYLTSAATACYWRTLLAEYGHLASGNGFVVNEGNRGMRFESFLLMGDRFQMSYGV